jgi:hypothetical protein
MIRQDSTSSNNGSRRSIEKAEEKSADLGGSVLQKPDESLPRYTSPHLFLGQALLFKKKKKLWLPLAVTGVVPFEEVLTKSRVPSIWIYIPKYIVCMATEPGLHPKRSTINDQRSMVNGQRSTVNDQRPMINDEWPLATGQGPADRRCRIINTI